MSSPSRLAVYSLALLLAAAVSVRADDPPKPKADPLSEAALIKLAKAGIDDDVIVALVKKRGVSFKTDAPTIQRLKTAGVSDAVLAAIRPAADDPKPAKGDGAVLATAKHPLGVTVEVLEVSIDQTQKKLKVVWRYTNPTKKAVRIADATPSGFSVQLKSTAYYKFFVGVNYRSGKLDAGEAIRYSIVKTVDGKEFDATDIKRLGILVPAEGSFEMYAKFPMPIDKSGKIHLTLPDLPQIENLPIEKAKQDK